MFHLVLLRWKKLRQVLTIQERAIQSDQRCTLKDTTRCQVDQDSNLPLATHWLPAQRLIQLAKW
jgi:hypothetical protein